MPIGKVFKHSSIHPGILEKLEKSLNLDSLDIKDQAIVHLHLRTALSLSGFKNGDLIKLSKIQITKCNREEGSAFDKVDDDTFVRLIFNFNAVENYSLRTDTDETVYTLEDGEFISYFCDSLSKTARIFVKKNPRRNIRTMNFGIKYHIRPRNYLRYTLIADFHLEQPTTTSKSENTKEEEISNQSLPPDGTQSN